LCNRICLIFWDSKFEILKCITEKIKKFFLSYFNQFVLRKPLHKIFASKYKNVFVLAKLWKFWATDKSFQNCVSPHCCTLFWYICSNKKIEGGRLIKKENACKYRPQGTFGFSLFNAYKSSFSRKCDVINSLKFVTLPKNRLSVL
jgi:hypothetical protein